MRSTPSGAPASKRFAAIARASPATASYGQLGIDQREYHGERDGHLNIPPDAAAGQ
jgi:hypothetical protein